LKHRIGRAWERSLTFRSLGLANASDTTGSLTRWGATVAFRRLGASNCVTPVLGHLRGCPAWAGAILAHKQKPCVVCGRSTTILHVFLKQAACGLRALAHKTGSFPFCCSTSTYVASHFLSKEKTPYAIASR